MYDTEHVSLPKTATKLFTIFLSLYPEDYRQHYGQEMYVLFADIYQEELARHGKVGITFLLMQVIDALQSIVEQHIQMMEKIGMKNYLQKTFHINKYNVIGGILLLPLVMVFSIDVVSRVVQRDLVHYNRPVYSLLSHTPFYWYPVLFTWAILFPMLAVLINLVPLFQSFGKNKTTIFSKVFVKKNLGSIIVLAIGLGFLALLKLHDFAPCTIHGLLRFGIGQLPHILSVCRNA